MNNELDLSSIIKLLEISVGELYEIENMISRTAKFYMSLTIAIIGFSIAVAKDGSQLFRDGVDRELGIVLIVLGLLAYKSMDSLYRRALEALTQRAKLEDVIGITDNKTVQPVTYWKDEPIIPTRYVNSRKKYKTSNDFVKGGLSEGFIVLARYCLPGVILLAGIKMIISGLS